MSIRNDMRPQVGDESISIPLTLDKPQVNGKERWRNRLYMAAGAGAIAFFLDLAYLIGSGAGLGAKLIVCIVLIPSVASLIIRHLILEEREFRADLMEQLANDYRMALSNIWGIYRIENTPPYVCYFKTGGRMGIFIHANKGSRVGNDTAQAVFDHYEGYAYAMREAGRRGIMVGHIDYMGSIGKDERIEGLNEDLANTENPSLRNDVLRPTYENLAALQEHATTPGDVYLLATTKGTGSYEDLHEAAIAFKTALCEEANWASASYMPPHEIGALAKKYFALLTFSASDAIRQSTGQVNYKRFLRPTRIIHADGTTTPIQ